MNTPSFEDYDGIAALHFLHGIPEADLNGYDNGLLVEALGDLGIATVLIGTKGAYNLEGQEASVYPIVDTQDGIGYADPISLPLGMGPGEIGVIRARVDTPAELEQYVSVVNGRSARAVGGSKWEQRSIAKGYMARAVSLEDGDKPFTNNLIDALTGDTLVVKADRSQNSNGIKIVNREDAAAAVEEMRDMFDRQEKLKNTKRKNKRILVEEFMKGESWPELRPIGNQSEELWNRAQSAELRVHCFLNQAAGAFTGDYYATARSFHDDGKDDWVSIDQASVPQKAWDVAAEVSRELLTNKVKVPGTYIAVDLFRSKPKTDNELGLYVREVNTRDPMMVRSETNEYDARQQRSMLAQAMAAVATQRI